MLKHRPKNPKALKRPKPYHYHQHRECKNQDHQKPRLGIQEQTFPHSPIDSLLHDTANIVSERSEVSAVGDHRSKEMKFIVVFCSYQRTLCVLCFPG